MKEKLIELLEDATAPLSAKPNVAGIRYIANRLIANGVTVRAKGEWVVQENSEKYLYWNCDKCRGYFTRQRHNYCPTAVLI